MPSPLPPQSLRSIALAFALSTLAMDNHAQETAKTQATNVTTVNFLNPGLGYERQIGKKQTLHFSAFLDILVSAVFSSEFSHTDVYADPALEAGYRYYFNFAKRENAGKRTAKNSANYLTFYSRLAFSKRPVSSSYWQEDSRRPFTILGTGWGMQRNYRKNFSLDLNLGIQYWIARSHYPDLYGNAQQNTRGDILPAGEIKLGFWLN